MSGLLGTIVLMLISAVAETLFEGFQRRTSARAASELAKHHEYAKLQARFDIIRKRVEAETDAERLAALL